MCEELTRAPRPREMGQPQHPAGWSCLQTLHPPPPTPRPPALDPPPPPDPHLVQHVHVLKVHGAVEGVGLDAADVVRLHGVQRVHQVAQLALEAAAHAGKLVAALHGARASAPAAGLGRVGGGGEEGAHKVELRGAQQLLVLRHHKVAVLGQEVVCLVRDIACSKRSSSSSSRTCSAAIRAA